MGIGFVSFQESFKESVPHDEILDSSLKAEIPAKRDQIISTDFFQGGYGVAVPMIFW
jgi:hypothetical protein